MNTLVFFFKMALVCLWVGLTCIFFLLICPFRWGDMNLVRDIGRVMHWGTRIFSGIRVEVEGMEHLTSTSPRIYACNHQSGFDVPVLGKIVPSKTVCIGKKELIWVPFFGILFKASGNVMIDRNNRTRAIAGLSEVVEAMREKGASILMFPEGTRNRTGVGLLPFKRGAFYMAISAGVPVVPIVISPLSPLLSLKEKRMKSGTLKVRVLPPVSVDGLRSDDVQALATRVRETMLEALRGLSTEVA